jgi:hypothetical protein
MLSPRCRYPGRPSAADRRVRTPALRRGSALAEFVLFLPFVFFILAMIFHFGVSNLRKQRTIVAARFAADVAARGIGDGTGEYWTNPISHNRYQRGQAYPDPQDHYKGLFDPLHVQPLFLPRVAVADVQVDHTWPDDGLTRLKQEMDDHDATTPPVTQVTQTFWEQPLAATNQTLGGDIDFRWHVYSNGGRITAAYRPNGPTFERLQGPLTSHYYRESASWAFPHPDLWWDLTRSRNGLSDMEQVFYELTLNPQMGRTADAFFRWFQH